MNLRQFLLIRLPVCLYLYQFVGLMQQKFKVCSQKLCFCLHKTAIINLVYYAIYIDIAAKFRCPDLNSCSKAVKFWILTLILYSYEWLPRFLQMLTLLITANLPWQFLDWRSCFTWLTGCLKIDEIRLEAVMTLAERKYTRSGHLKLRQNSIKEKI